MPKLNLKFIPTIELRAEIARRELNEPIIEPVKPQKWVCTCGNTIHGGGSFQTAFVEYGDVWCRICIPGCRPNLYGATGPVISQPMAQMDA